MHVVESRGNGGEKAPDLELKCLKAQQVKDEK
jgi:hypothetical protein